MNGDQAMTSRQLLAINEEASCRARVAALFEVLDAPVRAWVQKSYRGRIDAEVTVADTWVRVSDNIATFAMPTTDPYESWAALKAWVYQIAGNRAIDLWRHQRVLDRMDLPRGERADDLVLLVADRSPSIEDGYEQRELAVDVRLLLDEVMRTWTPRERACVLMGPGFAVTREEVMARYQMSRQALKSARSRMFNRIRLELVHLNASLAVPVDGIPAMPTSQRRSLVASAFGADPKRRPTEKPIGVASGLHRYLYSQCHTTGAEAGTVHGYRHVDAAVHLGVTSRQIQQWMRSLVARGHVTWVRQGNHLTVSIPGYVAPTTAAKGTRDAH